MRWRTGIDPQGPKGREIRSPAVAGAFYPENPEELGRMVDGFLVQGLALDRERADFAGARWPKALIAPHAGYAYSGPVAGSAYGLLRAGRGQIQRVVMMGPAHFMRFDGLATVSCRAFQTPLGQVPVDDKALLRLRQMAAVRVLDAAHECDHALEVHLPFLQRMLSHFTIVPLLTGECRGEEVAVALDALWGGPETLIVISSDLSHFHPYAQARAIDQATARAIESLLEAQVTEACGAHGIQGLLRVAAQRRLKVHTVDLRSSGDTAGAHEEVVGYGAFAFFEAGDQMGNR